MVYLPSPRLRCSCPYHRSRPPGDLRTRHADSSSWWRSGCDRHRSLSHGYPGALQSGYPGFIWYFLNKYYISTHGCSRRTRWSAWSSGSTWEPPFHGTSTAHRSPSPSFRAVYPMHSWHLCGCYKQSTWWHILRRMIKTINLQYYILKRFTFFKSILLLYVNHQ